MSRAEDVAVNPVTGERAVVRVGTEESGGELLVAELFVGPGGAVVGEHVHPAIEERFTVLSGRVGFRLDGREEIAELGRRLHVPAGVAHDLVERRRRGGAHHSRGQPRHQIRGGDCEQLRPGPGRQDERQGDAQPPAEDVLYFTKPPRAVQKVLFGVLAPVARLLGYKGSYPEYLERGPSERVEVEEPWTGTA